MKQSDKIYIAGHTGMVGSAIHRKLKNLGYNNIIYKKSSELDLRKREEVEQFFKENRPDYVFLAAAVVGGIQANIDNPVTFLLDNLDIQNNIIRLSHEYKVKRLLFLGSSCIYPREAKQPMKEEYLLTGRLEPTNEGYALAKIAGLKLVEYYNKQYGTNFISVMPCNIYGVNDNFDKIQSHVIAATITRIHEAKVKELESITIWGDGSARREFLFVDDLADAVVHLMENYYDISFINVGSGKDVSILELNEIVSRVIGYKGKIKFDLSKPNGMPRKLLDISKLDKLGWKHKVDLYKGISKTYEWYLNNYYQVVK